MYYRAAQQHNLDHEYSSTKSFAAQASWQHELLWQLLLLALQCAKLQPALQYCLVSHSSAGREGAHARPTALVALLLPVRQAAPTERL
jgi:hypothetical protein